VSTNYFFVSSPLHLLFSCNLALGRKDDENIVLLMPRETRHFSAFEEFLMQPPHMFDRVISFETGMLKSKYAERKRRMKVIEKTLTTRPADRIFTGTDRRVEFQYAMHVASRLNPAVTGAYVDEGMATYLGHKSAHNFAHMYIDPLAKKLIYGRWWNNPVTIGSSKWVSEVHAVYPEQVHVSLRSKNIVAIEKQYFADPRFIAFCERLLRFYGVDNQSIQDVDAIIVMTHESFYPDPDAHLRNLVQAVLRNNPSAVVAIKPHPRSSEADRYRSAFSEQLILDRRASMELFLPLVKKQCVIIGDISSALFTAKWFGAGENVVAVNLPHKIPGHIEDNLRRLFSQLGIAQIDIEQLPEYLAGLEQEKSS
jgi:hypothetical protein